MFNSQNHYFDSDPLDNYADLARKTKVVGQSVTPNPLGFEYQITVKLNGIDDLVLVVEQDYYLNRIVTPKLHYIHNNPENLAKTIQLTEMYLSAASQVGSQAETVKNYAINNLNLI